MKENNLTLEQAAAAAKKSGKSQMWKNALATTLGLAVGGTATAAILSGEDTPVVPEEDPNKDKPDTEVHHEAAPKARPVHHADTPEPQPAKELPEYIIYEQGIITTANGSQQHVGFGITANGRDCMIVDNDLDGRADLFYEDVSGNLVFEEAEVTNLHTGNIHISMNHLPGIEDSLADNNVPVDDNTFVVVADDTTVSIDKPENDDEMIAVVDGDDTLPDYTDDSMPMAAEDNSNMLAETPDVAPIDDPVIA